jgi:DNA-binding HxlR family transcriptional regulator
VVATPTSNAFRVDPSGANCPTRGIMERIGNRWTVLIVGMLGESDARFSRLLRDIEGISQKMLTQTLRTLERDGFVCRTVYPEVPIRVDYALTDAGRSLLEPLSVLQAWSVDHVAGIATAQKAYDAAGA